jgi:hypothetical protein
LLFTVKNTEYLQQAALEEYGPELHVALRSRRDELQYLRKLTELLFPYILPPKATDCRYKRTRKYHSSICNVYSEYIYIAYTYSMYIAVLL